MKVDECIIKPVYLETHLFPNLTNGRVELAAFFKPLVEDFTLLQKGITQNYSSNTEENVTIVVNSSRKIVAWTEGFDKTTNSAFSQVEIQDFLTQKVLDRLKKGKSVLLDL